MVTNKRRTIVIVGATGAVGRPLVALAAARGWNLRLVGRNRAALYAQAASAGDAEWWRVAALTKSEVEPALAGAFAVVNLVGPFATTTEPVLAAALSAGTHYLDIANEYTPVARVLGHDAQARDVGVTLMPAAGFGTVATEGLAAHLGAGGGQEACDGPGDSGGEGGDGTSESSERDGMRTKRLLRRVNVALFPQSAARSRGALSSVLGVLADGGAVIENGEYRPVALGHRAKRMLGPTGPTTLIPAATGDLAAIPASLGARFVTSSVGLPLPPFAAAASLPVVSAATRSKAIQRALLSRPVDSTPKPGPFISYSWARVSDESGASREGWMRAGEGYDFTVNALAAALERLLSEEAPSGAMTAIGAFGAEFLAGLPGVSIHSSLADALSETSGGRGRRVSDATA